MNYHDTLIEIADDCPAIKGQVPQARGGKKTKAVVEYELLVKHPYTYTEEDIAFEVYAVLHDIPKASCRHASCQSPPLRSGTASSPAWRPSTSTSSLPIIRSVWTWARLTPMPRSSSSERPSGRSSKAARMEAP